MAVKRQIYASVKNKSDVNSSEALQELLRFLYVIKRFDVAMTQPGNLVKNVCLLIPCYNEEKGIGVVIDDLPVSLLQEADCNVEVIVIDNNSKDRTAEVAASRGATVLHEAKQGKGCAIQRGFQHVPDYVDYVVMIDGDGSYDIREILRLLEPLQHNFADVVVGTRLHGKLDSDSMKALNRLGNWIFTFLARIGYQTNVTDVCSGFFAWKREVVNDLSQYLESNGFSIEMEMIAKMARLNYESCSVPISYHPREGSSNLRPIKDGLVILRTWFKYLRWKPKKTYIISPPRLTPHFHS
jgi:glycosyltransferase involved in cell wall biosynthesis